METTDIIVSHVRVSFPSIFKRPVINGEEGKFGAKLLLHPEEHAKEIASIKQRIDALVKEKLKGRSPTPDKMCLRENSSRKEYDGFLILSANNDRAPVQVGRDGATLFTSEEHAGSDRIYSGCYVNAKVRMWAQDNNFGKRVNAQLLTVQFAEDGDAFSGAEVSVATATEGFGAVDNAADPFGE